MRWHRWLVGSAAGLGMALSVLAAEERESFDLRVPVAPSPVVVEDRAVLFHELHLGNFSRQALVPERIEILADDGTALVDYAGDALSRRLVPVVAGADASPAIASGERRVLYVELALAATALPKALRHRVHYRVADDGSSAVVDGGDIAIAPPALVLGPPLRGGPWAAVFDPAWERGHRRVLYTVEGRAVIPGRFAIDFVKLDAEGRIAKGDTDVVAHAYGHGEAVLAVADADVVAVRNDYPEAERISGNGRHPLSKGSGNYVILALSDGRHAVYEHLLPGSVRVRPGQRVARGDVIAAVGMSGSGNWPHLHFHLADAASLLGAEGLPFAFERFDALGRYPDFDALGRAPWQARDPGQASRRIEERPADNGVIRFAD